MLKLVIVVIVCLISTSQINAQCRPVRVSYGTPIHHSPTYPSVIHNPIITPPIVETVVKEVIAPIAVPVLVPAAVFQYMPALQPVVPFMPATSTQIQPQVAGGYQPQVAGGYQPQIGGIEGNQQADDNLDAIIRERVDRILQERFGNGNKDDGPPILILPSNLPEGKKPSTAPTQDLNAKVAQILSNKCATCHTQGNDTKVRGDVTLFVKQNDKLTFQPNVSKDAIFKVSSPQGNPPRVAMPPTAKGDPNSQYAVRNGELDILRQWIGQR